MTEIAISRTYLMGPSEVPASRDDMEVVSVFNPGAARLADGSVVLLVRIAERPKEQRPGWIGLPRWEAGSGVVIDWTPEGELDQVDARVVRRKADGLVRLTFLSHLRVVRCGDGRSLAGLAGGTFWPASPLEEFGVEDPRLTFLNNRWYFTYVAVSRHGPATALASTTDFVEFARHGVIACPENKDVVLFPGRVAGAFAALHRPVCGTPFTRPEMWYSRSLDLIHWGGHQPIVLGGGDWQSGRVGAGAPPIKVPGGWLEIYHGNRRPTQTGEVGAYFGGALLLDEERPWKVIRRTAEPFFVPEADFERHGFVPDVVFPTSVLRDGGSLLMYYGAADACTCVAEFAEADLLATLT
ncbi:MAG: glycosylase [Isosphaeraceae bacterium]